MKKLLYTLPVLLICILACQTRPEAEDLGNGIYYWKTVFRLSEWDKAFLKEHNVSRLYLRVFDVDMDYTPVPVRREPLYLDSTDMVPAGEIIVVTDPEYNPSYKPVPVATVQFESEVPEGIEVVPVVYITNKCLEDARLCQYDSVFYKRIVAICHRNGFGNFRELQLDCDWSGSTQDAYFDFCKRIHDMAAEDSIEVSATIRLHQLRLDAPPVDRGVLMLYNTGSLYSYETENSILDIKDVAPYLKNDIAYSLPLSFSYPTYNWGIVIDENKSHFILHKSDYSDSTLYRCVGDHIYEVQKDHYTGERCLQKGMHIRHETSKIDMIRKVKDLVGSRLGAPSGNIIYHLDSLNLSGFSSADIDSIYF